MSFKVVFICCFEWVIISFRNAWVILDRASYPTAELYLLLKTKCDLHCKGLLEFMLTSGTFGKGKSSWAKKWVWKLWSQLPCLRMMRFTLLKWVSGPKEAKHLGTGGSFSVLAASVKTNHRKGCISTLHGVWTLCQQKLGKAPAHECTEIEILSLTVACIHIPLANILFFKKIEL